MGQQQIVYRVRVQLVQVFINLIGIFDLGNVFGRRENVFAAQHSRDLLKRKRVLLDGQRAVNGPNPIGAAQSGVCRQ